MSERFRTNYKNEIPIGEVRLYDMIDSNGAYIGKGVKLVRANGNLQEGDVFGEKEVNEIFKFFNGLLDGSEVVAKATNAENADKATKADDTDKISRLGLDGGYLPLAKDCLSLSASENGKLERVDNHSGNIEKTKNCPVADFIGTRQQLVMNVGWGIVILHEMYPVAGRTWMNAYNYTWTGWKKVSDGGNAASVNGFSFVNSGVDGTPSYVPGWPGGTPTGMKMYKPDQWSVNYANSAGSVALANVTGKPFTELKFLSITISTFASASRIYGRVSVGTQWNGCKVLASNRYAASTPVNQVNNITGIVSGGVLEISAYGAFVNGHMLSVDVLLMR